MAYTPFQVKIYLSAMAGAGAGLGASGRYLTDTNAGDYILDAQMADTFAQEIDAAWNTSGDPTPTCFETTAMAEICEAVWEARSPLEMASRLVTGSYAGIAIAIVELVQALNAQVVAEGVDPNGLCSGGGGSGTVTSVTGSAPIVITGTATIAPNVTITAATELAAGSMSAADKAKLDALTTANVQTIRFAVGAAAGTYTSASSLPAGAVVSNVMLDVTAAWAATTTISIGQTGALTNMMITTDNDPTTINRYNLVLDNSAVTVNPIVVTVGGAGGGGGAGFAIIQFSVPEA
jgi:hypothetical protein